MRDKIDDNSMYAYAPVHMQIFPPLPRMELAAGSHKKKHTQEPVKTINCAR